jgi:uncharacterized membrane protein YcaP (DUF421 family)
VYTVLHAIGGYLILLLTLRALRRRPGAQMTPFEFVLIFLMGGIIILTTMDDDHSVTNSSMGVITIGLMHRLVALIRQRFPRAAAIIDGENLVLLKDAQWQKENMRGAAVADDDVMAAARTKGVRSLQAIKYAVLERNGAISIIKKKQ